MLVADVHQRPLESGTTFAAAGGCALVSSNARRAISSLWLAMWRGKGGSVLFTDVSWDVAPRPDGPLGGKWPATEKWPRAERGASSWSDARGPAPPPQTIAR